MKEPIKARASRDFLRDLILGKEVVIKRKTTDRYGRTVAELEVDGVNVNELMVHEGYADVDERYADQCEWFAELMQD
nr:thermonuclease family protein [Synechococcus sp. KORDI-52]